MQNKHTSLEHLFACACGWFEARYPPVSEQTGMLGDLSRLMSPVLHFLRTTA